MGYGADKDRADIARTDALVLKILLIRLAALLWINAGAERCSYLGARRSSLRSSYGTQCDTKSADFWTGTGL